jgi:sparc/osteonectin/cwcv/kazal-like domain-containing proteoglycan (testican)
MFQQWDGDSDGRLTVEELGPLEGDEYEGCIKPFLDRCDINVDDLLSLDEWCDCFEWADHDRDEPPCHKAQRKHDPHLLGSWVPRCDVEGYFRPEQCHEGSCFCVDKWGREFDHSRVLHAHADCGQYAEETDDEDLHPEGSGDRRDL